MIPLGPFVLEREPFARGGMGVVFAGTYGGGRGRVALKVLEPRAEVDLPAMLEAEVRAAASLDHPNVVAVWDRGVVDEVAAEASGGVLAIGAPWYAMEHVGGGVLSWRRDTDWPAIRSTALQLLAALGHAHARGVLHRDIKPANVLFGLDGHTVKLADFGMGWRFVASRSGDDRVGGTPQYMAPEQFAGDRALQGPWTDLYAFGCVLFALVAGRTPFRGTFDELREQHRAGLLPPMVPRTPIPPGLHEVVERLTARACGERYDRAADVIAAIEGLDRSRSDPTVARRAAPSPGPVGLGLFGMRTVPIVGRTTERDTLWRSLEQAKATRTPRMVVLRGPTGVGKTRLAEWLCEAADESGAAVVLRTACGTGAERDGFAELVAERYHVPRGVDSDEAFRWILRAMSVEGSDEDEARRLAFVTSARPPSDARGPARTSPDDRAGMLLRMARRAASRRAVVVWFDDLDLDPDAVLLVGRLLAAKDLPALIVIGVSDVERGRRSTAAAFSALERRTDVAVLDLQPLSPDEGRALVRALLPVSARVAARVEQQASGHPLLAVQLVTHWVERGALRGSEGGFDLSADIGGPVAVSRVWADRLSAFTLGAADREATLVVAALLGRVVDRAEWRDAAREADLPDPDPYVDRLAELGFGRVTQAQRSFTFAHGLLRDVVIGLVSEPRRRELHRACARVAASAERRGGHLLAAADLDDAWDLVVAASQVRLRRGEPEAAHGLLDELERAAGSDQLDAGRRAELSAERAQIERLCGRFGPATALAEAAAAVAEVRPHVRIKALREFSVLLQYTTTDPRVLPLLDEAFAVAERSGADGIAALWIQRGRALEYLGRLNDAHAAYLTARRAALVGTPSVRSVDFDDAEVGEVLVGLSSVAHKLGRLDEAREAASEALVRFRARSLTWHEIWVETLLGEIARSQGDLVAAEGAYRGAIARYQGLSESHTALPRANLALVLALRGQFADALDEADAARQAALASGHDNLGRMIHLFVGWAAAGLGRWDLVDDALAEGVRLGESGLFDPDLRGAADHIAELCAAAGEGDRATRARSVAAAQAAALAPAER